MDKLMYAIMAGILLVTFGIGFKISNASGIQAGYFEKAEAPAYGVSGGDKEETGLSAEADKYFEDLLKEDLDE